MVLVLLGVIGLLIVTGTVFDSFHLKDLHCVAIECADAEEKQALRNKPQQNGHGLDHAKPQQEDHCEDEFNDLEDDCHYEMGHDHSNTFLSCFSLIPNWKFFAS